MLLHAVDLQVTLFGGLVAAVEAFERLDARVDAGEVALERVLTAKCFATDGARQAVVDHEFQVLNLRRRGSHS